MNGELREKILAFNRKTAERKAKAEDLEQLVEKLQPVLSLILMLLPQEVKDILKKYMEGIE